MDTPDWATLPQLMVSARERFPDTEALSEGEVSMTFVELTDQIFATARALMASGVSPGDRIAVWAPNIWEWVVAALGIHAAGAVLTPINTRFKGVEAAYILERSRATKLFTVADFLDLDYVAMLDGQMGVDALDEIIILRGGAPEGTIPFGSFLGRAVAVDQQTLDARMGAVQPDDLCHILFTSGTTGKPKGVMLDHGTITTVFHNLANAFDFHHGDRQLVVLPFFHSFGLHVGIVCSFMRGMTILPHLVFEPEALMRRIERDRITMLPGAPTVFQAILDHPLRSEIDLSTLKSIAMGGAGYSPSLIEELRTTMGIERVQTGYGLTETAGTVSLCSPPATAEQLTYTAALPLPGLDVKVVDETGTEVARGATGEIIVSGYALMRGYLDDPEATAETISADGWLSTGDIGRFREDGMLVITDRKKDMFSVGGFNAYPAEIEAMLAKHPQIAQVAVIGVPDHRLGEVGVAFVVPSSGTTPDPDEIIAWAREQMANYKVPRSVEIVDALPLNATGKVVKPELRAMVAARRTG